MKGKQISIVVAVVAVLVVVGVLALRGTMFPPGSTEGAIGAANRYTAGQITDADVVLKDANVQAFLQSDTFHKLATDAEFRNAVENSRFVELMRDPRAFEQATAAVEALRGTPLVLTEGGFFPRGAMAEPAIRKLPRRLIEALFSVENARLMEDARFVELMKSPEFVEAAKQGLPEALKLDKVEAFKPRLIELVRVYPDALQMLCSEAARNVTANAQYAQVFEALRALPDNSVAKAVADEATLSLMVEPAFLQVENLQAFQEALKGNKTELAALFASDVDWGKLTQKVEE